MQRDRVLETQPRRNVILLNDKRIKPVFLEEWSLFLPLHGKKSC